MAFLQDISPTRASGDIIAYLKADRPYKYTLMFVACIPAIIMVATFYLDAKAKATPPPPTITYFESWPASRTKEESLAAITKRQVEKDVFLEKQRQGYKKLGRALGMDVERIEQDAAKIRAEAVEAAKKAGKASVNAASIPPLATAPSEGAGK
jgi:hypothetical protein